MNIANLCVLIAAVLPFATVGIAKAQPSYDNANPRDFLAKQQGWRARADFAHRNHFEAFPPFAAAVILAEMMHAPQTQINSLALTFIGLRILYTAIYIAGIATLRTLVWIAALVCVVWLFLLSV
jgi:uncharacterized MAPEG superfamily protein